MCPDDDIRLEWFYDSKQQIWLTRVVSSGDDKGDQLPVEPYHLLSRKVVHPTIKVLGSVRRFNVGSSGSLAIRGSVDRNMSILSLVRLPAEISSQAVKQFTPDIEEGDNLLCLIRQGKEAGYYYTRSNAVGVKKF